jgi:hypothetical protein
MKNYKDEISDALIYADVFKMAIDHKFQVLTNDDDQWGMPYNVVIIRPMGGYNKILAQVPHGDDKYAAVTKAILLAVEAVKK